MLLVNQLCNSSKVCNVNVFGHRLYDLSILKSPKIELWPCVEGLIPGQILHALSLDVELLKSATRQPKSAKLGTTRLYVKSTYHYEGH